MAFWDEIRFPFDPAIQDVTDLTLLPIAYSDSAAAQTIEERYECDSGGSTTVIITNQTTGFLRSYQLGHWSKQMKAVKPVQRRKKGSAAVGA